MREWTVGLLIGPRERMFVFGIDPLTRRVALRPWIEDPDLTISVSWRSDG